MTALARISRYYLFNNLRMYFIITAAMLLLHLIASYMVDTLVAPEREAGLISPLVMVAALVIGETIFPSSFTYLLSQGISRKTYWLTTWLNLAGACFVCAVLVGIYALTMDATVTSIGTVTLFDAIYHAPNVATLIIWEFGALLMLATFGWMDRVISYRTGRTIRIIMLVGFVILWIGLAILNNTLDGVIMREVGQFLGNILGLTGPVPQPYTAVLSFLVISAGMAGITFLLLRRAPATD